MLGLLIYFAFLMVCLTILMFLRIRFEVSYSRKGQDDYLRVEMTTLKRLVRYKTEVPVMELDRYFLEPILKIESDIENIVTHPIRDKGMIVKVPLATILANIPNYVERGIRYAERYKKALRHLLKFIRCHDLRWTTRFGLDDPANTGIAAGFIWGLKGLLNGVFQSNVGVMTKSPVFSVIPCFNCTCLSLDFHCIFDMRIGHIIIAGLKFVKMRIKT